MLLNELLDALFPLGHEVTVDGDMFVGHGRLAQQEIAVIGTRDHAAVGVETALKLAAAVLDVVRQHPGRPVLMLVDTQGQRLARRDELLGINGYFAHLAQCLQLARNQGHHLLALVYAEAVSGGFLSFGMMADEIDALADVQLRVMNLPAMSRVTKVPLERLQELSQTSAVFAPGVENYYALGCIQDIWQPPLAAQLEAALAHPVEPDRRRELGATRGGRTQAAAVSARMRETPSDAS
jgi:malonate decarboxylase gamma subunit